MIFSSQSAGVVCGSLRESLGERKSRVWFVFLRPFDGCGRALEQLKPSTLDSFSLDIFILLLYKINGYLGDT